MTENVLITGANGGLGHLTTVRLLEAGHSVVATMRDIETRNLAAANELRAAGAHVVELDVTDESSVDAAVAGAIELVGHLDVVINNAGVGSTGLLETFTPADWLALFDINVFGVQRVKAVNQVLAEILPRHPSRGGGKAHVIGLERIRDDQLVTLPCLDPIGQIIVISV